MRERFTLYELPVILLTARSEPEDIYAGLLSGANDYVTKPVDALELKYRAWSLSSLKQAVNDRLSIEQQRPSAIHFFIADNGMGMSNEQLSKLLSPNGREGRGIGMFNTHSRLTRLYGHGLHIQSKPGEGTTVSFSIDNVK